MAPFPDGDQDAPVSTLVTVTDHVGDTVMKPCLVSSPRARVEPLYSTGKSHTPLSTTKVKECSGSTAESAWAGAAIALPPIRASAAAATRCGRMCMRVPPWL